MKRILLVVLVVCLLAGQASAGMYVMDKATAIDLREVTYRNALLPDSSLGWVGYNDGTAFPTPQAGTKVFGTGSYGEGMYYQVGFRGYLEDDSFGSPYPSVDIGAKANTNGVLTALKLLGSFDSYGLNIANDNDDGWEYNLYADFGATKYRSGTWTSLAKDSQTFLTLSFAHLGPGGAIVSSEDFSNLTDIGLEIRSIKSGGDIYHTSVVPVPAAVILGILGLGVVGIKLRKYA